MRIAHSAAAGCCAAVLIGLGVGCPPKPIAIQPITTASVAPAPPTARPEPADAPRPRSTLSGRYALEGAVTDDRCHTGVFLAAKHIEIDEAAGVLRADVVDREYRLKVTDAGIDAAGVFKVTRQCPGHVLEEWWELRETGEGILAGQLESIWPLAPACEDHCSVRFDITATRVDG